MKKTLNLTRLILLTIISFAVKGQTNVSGGIYSNTTWSLSGSPYIITDTVVVFPGFTLTIQPGVIVKFNDGKQLQIRQAALIALGTSSDSILFTSNSSATAGSWNNINLTGGTMTSKFNYCIFKYATTGISDNRGGSGDSLFVKNSTFSINTVGLDGTGTSYGLIDSCSFTGNTSVGANNIYFTVLNYCSFLHNLIGFVGDLSTINNSIINYNGTGINGFKGNNINHCIINYNGTAISCGRGCFIDNCIISYNQSGILTGNSIQDQDMVVKNSTISQNSIIGIHISNRADSVFNCQIESNGIGLFDNNQDYTYPTVITQNGIVNNTIGMQIPGTSDKIYCNKICGNTSYDLQYTGVNNISLANNYWCTTDSASTEVVIYDGYDNVSYGLVKFMPINTSCNNATGIKEVQTFSFHMFPNPADNHLTLELPETISKADIKVYNTLGDLVHSSNITVQSTSIDISALASGLYVIQIIAGSQNSKQRFIKQ